MQNLKQRSLFKKDLSKIHSNLLNRIYKKRPDLKFKEISSYAKIYPDFVKIIKYNRPVVVLNCKEEGGSGGLSKKDEQDYLEKSINRTKTRISDYILCNEFTHFVTFTFDRKNSKVKSEEDRHDLLKMSKLLITWVNTEQVNHFRRHGKKFKYLIVPERHKTVLGIFTPFFKVIKMKLKIFIVLKINI